MMPVIRYGWGTIVNGVLIACAAFSLLFFQLGAEPFQDYDEATYAEVVQESAVHHDYLSFTYLNQPFLEKPPLEFWLIGGMNSVLPNDHELAARLPSAIAALLLIGVVVAICREAGASREVSLLAGGILATTSAFIEPARQVRMDILVALFIVLALYFSQKIAKDARWYIAVGAAIGLAVLAKSVIAAFAAISVAAYLFTKRDRQFYQSRYFWLGILVAIIIAIPWHAYETYIFGWSFWQDYLGTQVFSRMQTNVFGSIKSDTNSDYVRYFFSFAAPWSELCVVALTSLPFVYKRLAAPVRQVIVASTITLASIVVVVATSRTKVFSYLIPLYPFVAIIIALMVGEFVRLYPSRLLSHMVATLAVLLFVPALCWTAYNGFHLNHYYAAEVELAQEEKQIGLDLRRVPQVNTLYTYETQDIGSVEFYSQLQLRGALPPLRISASRTLEQGTEIVTPASPQALHHAFPEISFIPAFNGHRANLYLVR